MAQLLLVGTAGVEDPSRATLPFHLAKAGKENGMDIAVVLAGDATLLMREAIRDNIHGVGFPPLRELFGHARASGVPLHV